MTSGKPGKLFNIKDRQQSSAPVNFSLFLLLMHYIYVSYG